MDIYNEYIKTQNKVIEEWYNLGIISLEERNKLYKTKKEIEEPNDFIDIPGPNTSNESNYSLYNRNSDFLNNSFFDKNHSFFNIKSYDGLYYLSSINGKVNVMKDIDIIESNISNIEWNLIKDNTDFVRLANKYGAYLDVNDDKELIIKELKMEETDFKKDSNLWKLKKVEEDNSNLDKYYIESVYYPGFRLDFSDEKNIVLKTGFSKKNICIFEPIDKVVKLGNVKSEYLLELERLLEKHINSLITKMNNKNYNNILDYYSEEELDNTRKKELNEIIGNINSKDLEKIVDTYGLINVIKAYLENKSSELRTKNFKNTRFLNDFKKNKEKYVDINRDISKINNKTSTLEDNIYILNENNSYNNFKINSIYFIRICFIIIAFILFISICKNIYKRIN